MSKALFDTFRSILGRGLRQSEVDTINASLEGRTTPRAPSLPEYAFTPSKVGEQGVALIKRFEGCARVRADGLVEAYPDPGTGGEPWTIGWGATGADRFNGGRIRRGTVWTQAQCEARFLEDLPRYAADVIEALGPAIHSTSQRQFDALVSFHYNTGAIARATLTRKHVAGDYQGAAREFDRWTRAGRRVLQGLVRRRKAEAGLYLEGTK